MAGNFSEAFVSNQETDEFLTLNLEKIMTDYTEKQIEETDETFMDAERVRALAAWLEIDPENVVDEVTEECGDNLFEAGGGEYLVVTDDEADVLWEEGLDNYIEECIQPELPDNMQMYFDEEAWKRDARMDGRGHVIASYDFDENDGTDPVSGEDYIIFRVN